MVYDVTNRQSFDNIIKWLTEMRAHCDSDVFVPMLIGNKSDLRHLRAITVDEAKQFAGKNMHAYF